MSLNLPVVAPAIFVFLCSAKQSSVHERKLLKTNGTFCVFFIYIRLYF